MTRLLFASRNKGKVSEVAQMLEYLPCEVISLEETSLSGNFDVEETADTFAGNSELKARGFGIKLGLITLADDSGLEVDALGGRPGVYSKRYGHDDSHRIERLLAELVDIPEEQRKARFICDICGYNPQTGETIHAEGVVEGKISYSPRGNQGFGYDPIFIPDEGNGNTFAEYGADYKNIVSHRARALQKIRPLLQEFIAH